MNFYSYFVFQSFSISIGKLTLITQSKYSEVYWPPDAGSDAVGVGRQAIRPRSRNRSLTIVA